MYICIISFRAVYAASCNIYVEAVDEVASSYNLLELTVFTPW
jgi:hypothetical protein